METEICDGVLNPVGGSGQSDDATVSEMVPSGRHRCYGMNGIGRLTQSAEGQIPAQHSADADATPAQPGGRPQPRCQIVQHGIFVRRHVDPASPCLLPRDPAQLGIRHTQAAACSG